MAISLEAIKWNKIFQGEVLEWPEQLTKVYWDKKKGNIITVMKSTGIGEALKKCEEAFKAAKMGEVTVGGRNPDEVDHFFKANVIPFITGTAMKKLHDDLKELKDVAQKTAKEIKKNVVIPSSTKKLVDEIAAGAELMMVFCNTNSLSGYAARVLEEKKKELNTAQVSRAAGSLKLGKGMGKKALNAVAEIRQEIEKVTNWEDEKIKPLGSTLFTACRDMTQPLLNLVKSIKAGAQFKNLNQTGVERLAKIMVPYGDGDEAKFAGHTREECEKKLVDVEKMAKAYEIVFEPIEPA
jgi:hypothetical protein